MIAQVGTRLTMVRVHRINASRIGRIAIIQSSSRNTIALIRRLFRPTGNISIRIINQFIRRRGVQVDGRHLHRGRARLPTEDGFARQTMILFR